MNLEVTARFITKGGDAPLTGDAYKFRLFDKDVLTMIILAKAILIVME